MMWQNASMRRDGTDRFRYFIGDDARGFIKAKQAMSDQDYIAFVGTRFLAKP